MEQLKQSIPTQKDGDSATWLVFALLAAVLTLHVLANSLHISDKFFWLDEASTYFISKKPFLEAARFMTVENNHNQPPLYYWLAHIVIRFDDSTSVLRGISFAFMTGTLVFVMLGLKELSISSRLVLSVLLTLNPFALYASTEFRPYAMAVFFIVVSSVFLYRALAQRERWGPPIWYGLSALGLQYSITLNCWVFFCQMLCVCGAFLLQAKRQGLAKSLASSRALLGVSLFLCVTYTLFLLWISQNPTPLKPSLLEKWTYWTRLLANAEWPLFREIMGCRGLSTLSNLIALALFGAGAVLASLRHMGIGTYLLMLFFGQLGFSTYMTYSRIDWFAPRYLTSCYVSFALLGSLGYELFVAQRWPGKKALFAALLFLLLLFPHVSTTFTTALVEPPLKGPWREVINEAKCSEEQTLVLCSPGYLWYIPGYAFRTSHEVYALSYPSLQELQEASDKGLCILYFVLNTEEKAEKELELLEFLKKATNYQVQEVDLHCEFPHFKTSPHFPDILYVFRPNSDLHP